MGKPVKTRVCPSRTVFASPNSIAGSALPAIFNSARSCSLSTAATVAVLNSGSWPFPVITTYDSLLKASRTSGTTWALVTTWKPSSSTNPVPGKLSCGDRVFCTVPIPTIDGLICSIILTSSLPHSEGANRSAAAAQLLAKLRMSATDACLILNIDFRCASGPVWGENQISTKRILLLSRRKTSSRQTSSAGQVVRQPAASPAEEYQRQ